MAEQRPQSDLAFRKMALEFWLRDLIRPPARILREAAIDNGMVVLDYGCGPGGFALAAARMVGAEGRVWALDVHPLAVKMVARAASKGRIKNIETILGSDLTELGAESVDVALLYDVLHEIPNTSQIVGEIRRVLKPKGVLSVSDHHLAEETLSAAITAGGLFRLAERGRWTFRFEPSPVAPSHPGVS